MQKILTELTSIIKQITGNKEVSSLDINALIQAKMSLENPSKKVTLFIDTLEEQAELLMSVEYRGRLRKRKCHE